MKPLCASAIASTIFLILTITSARANAAVFTLYNASDPTNTTPDSQGVLQVGAICAASSPLGPCNTSGSIPFQVAPSQTLVTGGVQLDTAANSAEYSGYSNYDPFSSYVNSSIFSASTLNQATGYTITFTMQLNSATDNTGSAATGNPTRAAFSILAVSSNTTKAIEIGFRANEIFAQTSSFTAPVAQSTNFDTSTALNTYKLTVFNNTYSLTSGATNLINGSLVDYTTFNPSTSSPPLPFNPYNTPSFIFFGDDTGKESGVFTLGDVTLDTTPVPFDFSPTYGLIALGAIALFKQR